MLSQRKFADGARVKGKEEGRGGASFRGRTGTVLGYTDEHEYKVKFDDGLTEYVPAHQLDPA